MKVLIAVFSLTGKTTQIARAIEAEVSARGHQVDLREVGKTPAEDLDLYDLVFLGSACHDADLALPAVRLLESIDPSPAFKLAGFVTHATQMPEEGPRARELYERWAGSCIRTFERIAEEKGIPFLGYYHCQGAPSPPIEAFIHNQIVTDEDEWAEYVAEVRTHPDEADLERARAFAAEVLDVC
jgi:flavodoxin